MKDSLKDKIELAIGIFLWVMIFIPLFFFSVVVKILDKLIGVNE